MILSFDTRNKCLWDSGTGFDPVIEMFEVNFYCNVYVSAFIMTYFFFKCFGFFLHFRFILQECISLGKLMASSKLEAFQNDSSWFVMEHPEHPYQFSASTPPLPEALENYTAILKRHMKLIDGDVHHAKGESLSLQWIFREKFNLSRIPYPRNTPSLCCDWPPQFRKQWLKNLRGENHHPRSRRMVTRRNISLQSTWMSQEVSNWLVNGLVITYL